LNLKLTVPFFAPVFAIHSGFVFSAFSFTVIDLKMNVKEPANHTGGTDANASAPPVWFEN
jgi:hypothetical protein